MVSRRRLLLSTAVAATISMGYSLSVSASETLRVADSFPSGHFIDRFAVQPFIERASERSEGRISFEHYPAQQLGRAADLLALAQTGVADIAYVGPSYVSDRMPLSAVAQLPGFFTSSCEGSMAYWQLLQEGPLHDEFAENDVVPIFAFTLPAYQIYTRDRLIESVDSFSGLRLRTTGGAMDITASSIGAVPTRMAAPDVYEAITRGTLDGLIFPVSSIHAYDLGSHIKSATIGENFGSFVATYVMSRNRWDSLSEEDREVLSSVGAEIVQEACALIDADEEAALARLRDLGAVVVELSPEDKSRISELLANVSGEWAEDLDARGFPGSETVRAFRDAVNQ